MNFGENFEIEFMKRTLELVKQYKGPFDASLLLNCLLGLLIVPKESSIDIIPEDPLEDLKIWGISPESIISPGKKRNKKQNPEPLRGIVWDLRNSVAHFQFTPYPDKEIPKNVGGFEFTANDVFKAKIELNEMKVFVEKLFRYLNEKSKSVE